MGPMYGGMPKSPTRHHRGGTPIRRPDSTKSLNFFREKGLSCVNFRLNMQCNKCRQEFAPSARQTAQPSKHGLCCSARCQKLLLKQLSKRRQRGNDQKFVVIPHKKYLQCNTFWLKISKCEQCMQEFAAAQNAKTCGRECRSKRAYQKAVCGRDREQWNAYQRDYARLHKRKATPNRLLHTRLRRRTDRHLRDQMATSEQWHARLEEFGGLCAYCPQPGTTIDHVVPVVSGGTSEIANLVPCCAKCNSRKGAMALDDWMKIAPDPTKIPTTQLNTASYSQHAALTRRASRPTDGDVLYPMYISIAFAGNPNGHHGDRGRTNNVRCQG